MLVNICSNNITTLVKVHVNSKFSPLFMLSTVDSGNQLITRITPLIEAGKRSYGNGTENHPFDLNLVSIEVQSTLIKS